MHATYLASQEYLIGQGGCVIAIAISWRLHLASQQSERVGQDLGVVRVVGVRRGASDRHAV